jgi:hypothetical protein
MRDNGRNSFFSVTYCKECETWAVVAFSRIVVPLWHQNLYFYEKKEIRDGMHRLRCGGDECNGTRKFLYSQRRQSGSRRGG